MPDTGPFVAGLGGQLGHGRRGEQLAGVVLAIVGLAVETAPGLGQGLQLLFPQTGDNGLAAAIGQPAPAAPRHRATVLGADAQDMEADPLVRQGPRPLRQALLVEVAVADEQDGPGTVLGQAGEQGLGPVQGAEQAAALKLGQVRGQGRQGVEQGLGVLGDGREDVGHRGEGEEADAHLAVLLDQVLDLLTGPRQAMGGDVGDLHGTGDVQQDEQVVAGVKEADVGVVPARPGHARHQQRPEQGPEQEAAPAFVGLQLPGAGEVRQKVWIGIAMHRPARRPSGAVPQPEAHRQRHQQGPEPERLGEVEARLSHAPASGPGGCCGRQVTTTGRRGGGSQSLAVLRAKRRRPSGKRPRPRRASRARPRGQR